MKLSLHIIYASTSGHTEYVVSELQSFLEREGKEVSVLVKRAEQAIAEDLTRGDILLLASGTWNTGGIEGQLNPHMDALLVERMRDVNLEGKPMAFIGLGDQRYYYTTRCIEHFQRFRKDHGGTQIIPPLVIVNEPYGQEQRIVQWGQKLIAAMAHKSESPAS